MEMRLQHWIDQMANAGSLPSDTTEQRLRKAVLVFLAGVYSIAGILWGIAYLALDLPLSGSIPLGYAAVSGGSLYYFFRTKHYRFFRFSQLLLILILPFSLQFSLGGFAASGAVMIWAILSPIGALMFAGTARALPWFLAYLLIMSLSGILDGKFMPHTPLPLLIVVISFVMNIGGVSAIVFVLLKYFVSERERAMAALDEAHRRVRHSLSLAREVQQSLLPKANPKIKGLDIAGKSIYCDETGGDYYDFLESSEYRGDKVVVVVGDVSEHGIPSALLMATVRAIIRQRSSLPGSISEIVTDVNHQLAKDVEDSGRFMTLFYAVIDRLDKSIWWLNAGHEPAIVYDPVTDIFNELSSGSGLPLGVFEDSEYTETRQSIVPGQIIVLTTDGIIEAHNPIGDMFGKNRLYDVIRQNATSGGKEILNAIIGAVAHFQKDVEHEDDMTLVVIKIESD